ncbi:MAG: glycosyltransferase family 39 protein [Verrucomicrobiales bacterium]|nr:glycosyltransferase family 39 protein [Verrucomicrobiales bacterium]
MSSPLSESPYRRRAFLLVAVVLILRLIYVALFAVNPAGDEAYYWDWGRQLDYGYYSKPPFIAWLYAFVDWVGGGSLFAIRASAVILGTLSLLILFRLTEDLFDAKTAWFALLLGITAPANSVLSFFLTIDAPLVMCWSLALFAFHRYLSGKGGTGYLWLLFFSLAIGHLSKQMMMIFPVLAILFLLIHRETRPLLRRGGLWAALLGSFLALTPPLVWNAQNDWITFEHTSHHFEVIEEEGNVVLERAEDFLSFIGTQLGVIGPAVGVILLSVSLVALPQLRRLSRSFRFLLVFGALPLAGMLLLALRQGLQPNWPAVFYISGMALTAAWYRGMIPLSWPPKSWQKLFPVAIAMNLVFVTYFYAGPLIFQIAGKPGHTADPNRRLLGHDLVAAEVQKIRETIPDATDLFLIASGHRDVVSHLAFCLPDQPHVYHFSDQPGIRSQYDLWPNPSEAGFNGKDGLIVVPNSSAMPAALKKHFEETEKVGEFEVPFGWDRSRKYSVFRGVSLTGWPHLSPPDSSKIH